MSAQKNNYRYIKSSEALDYSDEDVYKQPQRKKVLRKIKKGTIVRRVKNDKPKISWYVLITIIIIFMGTMSVSINYTLISSDRYKASVLSKELKILKEENAALRVQISESYDIKDIERIATLELKMSKPKSHQIIHITIPKESYSIVHNSNLNYYFNDYNEEEKNFLNKILSFFNFF